MIDIFMFIIIMIYKGACNSKKDKLYTISGRMIGG